MKLLKVKSYNFKNCKDGFEIDFLAKSKKTAEDRKYELQEIAPNLFVFNTAAFIGRNASGKTTAIDLLDCCFSILSDFRLEGKHYDYDNIRLEIYFYHDEKIYKYQTRLMSSSSLGNQASFHNEKIFEKKYYKSKVKEIYSDAGFKELIFHNELPEDTSKVFYILKKKTVRAVYFDSYSEDEKTYQLAFKAMNNYGIDTEILRNILRIFDENIKNLDKIDEHNFELWFRNEKRMISDTQLLYFLSSGTTRGILLYVLMVASLQEGFDLLIDEVEKHFHKTLVENMISLYKDDRVNKKNASLIFTTHYCEVLDLFNRQDNIWICKSDDKVYLNNWYSDYNVRPEILKSKQFYSNAFQTAISYEGLMRLKGALLQ